jgi:hypothetical protein
MNKNYTLSNTDTLPRITSNKNPLVVSDGFRLVFARTPNVQYFAQSIIIPAVTVNEVAIPRGRNTAYVPGDTISYEPVTVTMMISEDMENFKEIYDWLNKSVAADKYDDKFDDLTIYILTSKNNPNKKIMFKNVFPTSIGNVNFSVQEADIVYATVDVTFRYDYFTFE